MRVTIRPLTVGMLTQALHSSCILRLNVHGDQQFDTITSESDGGGKAIKAQMHNFVKTYTQYLEIIYKEKYFMLLIIPYIYSYALERTTVYRHTCLSHHKVSFKACR